MEDGERTEVALGRGCALPLIAGGVAATLLLATSVVVELVTRDEREYAALAAGWAVVICAAAVVWAAFGWAGRADASPERGVRPAIDLTDRATAHVDLMWRAGGARADMPTAPDDSPSSP